MTPAIELRRYTDLACGLANKAQLDHALDEIFFEASNTKSFADGSTRSAFRERWLGRYLAHWPDLALIAVEPQLRTVAGYIVGCHSDPALDNRFSDLGYVQAFAHLSADFPAHLHVNLAPGMRGKGVGAQLLEAFAAEASRAGCPGVHAVTSRSARNVLFYNRCGFAERGSMSGPAGDIVFLGRRLDALAS
jgi:GNAT superfamily N-acetyltransferase